jgi:hypothetical protein
MGLKNHLHQLLGRYLQHHQLQQKEEYFQLYEQQMFLHQILAKKG